MAKTCKDQKDKEILPTPSPSVTIANTELFKERGSKGNNVSWVGGDIVSCGRHSAQKISA